MEAEEIGGLHMRQCEARFCKTLGNWADSLASMNFPFPRDDLPKTSYCPQNKTQTPNPICTLAKKSAHQTCFSNLLLYCPQLNHTQSRFLLQFVFLFSCPDCSSLFRARRVLNYEGMNACCLLKLQYLEVIPHSSSRTPGIKSGVCWG